jgi:predicted HicB family RNase H-like nuclease
MSKKPKVGRPKLPKGEIRAAMVVVRFRPDERRRLETAAAREGSSLSPWARRILLAAASA